MIWLRLAAVDAKQTMRDPKFLFMLMGPLLVLFALRYGAPYGLALVPESVGPDTVDVAAVVAAFGLLLVPLLPGTMAGLQLLDERDERLVATLAVTPLSKDGYFRYRLAIPFVGSVVYLAALPYGSGLLPAGAKAAALLPAIAASTGLAPMFAAAMGALAASKLEGLAVSKLSGWLVFAPALLFVPEPAQWIGAAVPTYWIAKSCAAAFEGDVLGAYAWGVGGGAYLSGLFFCLFRKYLRRVE